MPDAEAYGRIKSLVALGIKRFEADVVSLMAQLQHSLERRDRLPWQEVLPIYPTSPVGPV